MCRFTVYKGHPICLADLVTRPSRSIIRQSYDCRERLPGVGSNFNADGFGIGWWTEDPRGPPGTLKPGAFKSDRPAWSNDNLRYVSENVTSGLFFAHVRAATPGLSVCEQNCHPFMHGSFLFMMNGEVANFAALRRKMITELGDTEFQSIKGSTDAEYVFALFLSHIHTYRRPYCAMDIVSALKQTIQHIVRLSEEIGTKTGSLINIAVSDGHTVVASRFTHRSTNSASLYFSSGSNFECYEGEYQMETSHRKDRVTIISSEPLTDGISDWVPIPDQTLIVVTDKTVLLIPIDHNVDLLLSSILGSGVSGNTPPESPRSSRGGGLSFSQFTRSPPAKNLCTITSTSLTKDCKEMCTQTTPLQTLSGHSRAVVCIEVHNKRNLCFTGGLDFTVRSWDLETFRQNATVNVGSPVMALYVHEPKDLLLVSVASMVTVWGIAKDKISLLRSLNHPHRQFLCMYIIGDYLYAGGPDTKLHILRFYVDSNSTSNHESNGGKISDKQLVPEPLQPQDWLTIHAHYGFINALALVPASPETGNKPILLSAAGDALIKGWSPNENGVHCVHTHTFSGHTGSVLDLSVPGPEGVFYSCSMDMTCLVWDVKKQSCLHTLDHTEPLVSIAAEPHLLVTVDVTGGIKVWSRDPHTLHKYFCASGSGSPSLPNSPFSPTQITNDTTFFAMGRSLDFIITAHKNDPEGCSIRMWDLASIAGNIVSVSESGIHSRSMIALLRKFVAYKSVSSNPNHIKDCFNAAAFLKSVLEQMLTSFSVKMIRSSSRVNPVVFAYLATCPAAPTVIVYGHYDVVDVQKGQWQTDPFEMSGRDGYYYARGTTDNKGPIMAVVHAIYELTAESKGKDLSSKLPNILLIFEGSQETDSGGILEACQELDYIKGIDKDNATILVLNTYWLGDNVPCLVYGLRGIVEWEVEIEGASRDLHSGIDGGLVQEPMQDMINLLSGVTDTSGHCLIPGWYEDVAYTNSEELEKLFQDLKRDFSVEKYKQSRGIHKFQGRMIKDANDTDILKCLWLEPSLTIHGIHSTACEYSLIPSTVSAYISVRTVPNQDPSALDEKLQSFLYEKFEKLESGNELRVTCQKTVDWWQGDYKNKFYAAAHKAIAEVWGQDPMYIQEGGTMKNPLKEVIDCPCLHLPIGQGSDCAHLPNERIRWENLVKGKGVLKNFFTNLAVIHDS